MRLLRLIGLVASLALAPQLAVAQSPGPGRPQFDDRQQVLAINATVKVLFENDDFTTLEKLADEFRTLGSVTSSGRPNLDAFYGSFNWYPITGELSDPRIGKTKRWLAAFPNSRAAHIVMGIVLENRTLALGQLAGNSVIAGTKALYEGVPAKIGQGFRDTERFLTDSEPLLEDEPFYHSLRLDLAARRGAKEEEILAMYKTAATRFPDYYQLKFEAFLWLSQVWNNDPGKIEAFISEATIISSAQNGEGDYADLYWWRHVLHGGGNPFTQTKASWPRVRHGIEDRIKRFGGLSNANHYALLACFAGDQAIAKRMFEMIGNNFDPEVWDTQKTLDQCWLWAIQDVGGPLGRASDVREPATSPQ